MNNIAATKLNFSYESPENLVHLLVNVLFEKKYTNRDISIYHSRFDKESDNFFKECMERLYPDGCTIGQKELEKITDYVFDFMHKDEKTVDMYVEYDKKHMYSYVYCAPFKEIQYADCGQHAHIVSKFCQRFFKGFDKNDLSIDKIEKFIRNNIEIKSDYTSIDLICEKSNLEYIVHEILFYKEYAIQ